MAQTTVELTPSARIPLRWIGLVVGNSTPLRLALSADWDAFAFASAEAGELCPSPRFKLVHASMLAAQTPAADWEMCQHVDDLVTVQCVDVNRAFTQGSATMNTEFCQFRLSCLDIKVALVPIPRAALAISFATTATTLFISSSEIALGRHHAN